MLITVFLFLLSNRNEVKFYTEILPELYQFQRNKMKTNLFNSVPECYYAKNNLLILEDLHVRDFKMADRRDGLPLEHAKAVIIELARFHSLSLAYKVCYYNYMKR